MGWAQNPERYKTLTLSHQLLPPPEPKHYHHCPTTATIAPPACRPRHPLPPGNQSWVAATRAAEKQERRWRHPENEQPATDDPLPQTIQPPKPQKRKDAPTVPALQHSKCWCAYDAACREWCASNVIQLLKPPRKIKFKEEQSFELVLGWTARHPAS